ncbi:hypothetical protein ACLQ2K_30000, partial [Streptomyces sp. DT17]
MILFPLVRRAVSISRWSGISHHSSNGPCAIRTGSGSGPGLRANGPVPPARVPGGAAPGGRGPRDLLGR